MLPHSEHIISVKYNGFEGYLPSTSLINTTVNVCEININIDNATYGNNKANIYSTKNGNYTLKINNITYTNITLSDKENVTISILNLKPSSYNATITDVDNENISSSTVFTVLKLTPTLKY